MRFNTIGKTEEDLDKELIEKYRTTDDIEYLRRNILHLHRCATTNSKFQQRLLKLGTDFFPFETGKTVSCGDVLTNLEDCIYDILFERDYIRGFVSASDDELFNTSEQLPEIIEGQVWETRGGFEARIIYRHDADAFPVAYTYYSNAGEVLGTAFCTLEGKACFDGDGPLANPLDLVELVKDEELEKLYKDETQTRTGREHHSEPNTEEVFTKFDSGKAPLYLLAQFKEELGDVAHVLMSGAEKYGMDNWKKCDDSSRYYSAGLRHYFQYVDGEMLDEESGKPHAVHAIVNLLFSLYLDNKLKKESKE